MKNLYLNLSNKTSKAIISMFIIMLFCGSIFVQKVNAQLFDEPFTTSLNGWTVEVGTGDDVSWASTNSAGGTTGEINITGNSQTAIITDRLYSPAVNTTGMSTLTLTWDNFLDHYGNTWVYSVAVETSTDGIVWHPTSWVTNPVTADIPVGQQTVTINNSDVGSATFRVAFTTTGQTFGFYHWYIDNPKLVSACINHTLFTVSGGGCNSGSVDLSGSQTGIDYELFKDAVSLGQVVTGTGSAISFGTQSVGGVYTVRTIGDATYCSTLMTGSATVTPTPSVSSASSGSICGGIALNYNITSAVPGTTYNWSRAAVAGISNNAVTNQTSNPIMEVLTNTTAGPVNVIYQITPSANGCPGIAFTFTVTVNPGSTAPTVGTIVQPSCSVGTGSVTLSGLPATGSWTIIRTPGAVNTNGSGASYQITGLPGSATYTFTVTNSFSCTSAPSSNVVINASPIPPTPVVTQVGINLHSSAATGNQWYNQASGLIAGAVNQNYPVTANGYYYCIVTISGCSSDTSNIFHFTNVGIENIELNNKIVVYPNPSSDKMFVDFGQVTEIPLVAKLFNSLGQVVFESTQAAMTKQLAIDVHNVNSGMYTLQIIFDKGIVNKEVIVK